MSVMPPRWAEALLRRVLPDGDWGSGVRGDLHQEFWSRVRQGRTVSARFWFAGQALSVAWCSLRDRLRGHAWGRRGLSSMHMTGLGAELRQTIRGLARRPGRTALVVLTLAAGIAATTTVYTVVDTVILRPLPYAKGDRLVTVGMLFEGREWRADAPNLQHLAGSSVATVVDWQARTRSFEALEAVEQTNFLISDAERGPELVRAAAMTPGFLSLIGARVELGRSLQASDFLPTAPRVGLLSYSSWMQRHGGDADIIGKAESNLTIVGVLSADVVVPEAVFARSPEYWIPLIFSDKRYAERGRRSANVIGVLAEGVTLEAARSELAAVQFALGDEFPNGNVLPDGKRFGAGANALHAETVGASATPLALFLGAATLLLLIAGMNSANLLFLRSLEREGEMALRRALGANRLRLIAGLLLEGVVLAMVAGVLGVLLAELGVRVFLHIGPASIPRLAEVAIDGRVLAVSAGVSLGTGLLAAFWPALRLARSTNLGTGIRDVSSPAVTSSGSRVRLSLVVAQLSIAVVLAVGASLLLNALVRVSNQHLGFEPRDLTSINVPFKQPGADAIPASVTWDRALDAVRNVSGITSVAVASDPPFADPSWAPWVSLPGAPANTRLEGVAAFVVTPEFFDTIAAPVTAGRGFSDADSEQGEPVIIVNEAFVAAHLGEQDPIGAAVLWRAEGEGSVVSRRVVGVAGDVVQRRVEDPVSPAMYVPAAQTPWPYALNILVRSQRSGAEFTDELRQAVSAFAPGIPILALYPMTTPMETTLMEPQFRAALFAGFAGISLLLAVIGLYGSLSHTVGRRTRELGLRMALGADRRSIFSMVLKQGAAVAGVGISLGLIGAALVARSLQSFLYGVSPLDPMTFVLAALVLGGVAMLAAFSPARRAAGVDVMTSLRE